MKDEKFKVIDFIRKFILEVDKQLDNFPKKDIELKNRIRTASYDLLEISYMANSMEDKSYKKELLYKAIAKIKIIDFLINMSYDKKIITEKKYFKLGLRLNDIAKYTSGWLKTIIEK